MSDQIKLITSPDLIFDQSRKILVIQPKDDLKKQLESWALDQSDALSIYYAENGHDMKWLLTAAGISDIIILECDTLDKNISQFASYLISLPHTYYRCENMKAPWELLNKNRFYDFPNFERT